MCFDYWEYAEFASARMSKARKQHHCNECGGAIGVGEEYERHFSIFCGDASVFRSCSLCCAIREKIRVIEEERGCQGLEAVCPYGDLWSSAPHYDIDRDQERLRHDPWGEEHHDLR